MHIIYYPNWDIFESAFGTMNNYSETIGENQVTHLKNSILSSLGIASNSLFSGIF